MAVKRGDIIITSNPFAYVVISKRCQERCATCLLKKDDLKRCMKCHYAFYCDRTCQKNAWPDHKLECASLKKVHPRVPPDFILLLARIIRKLKREPDYEEKVGNVSRRFSDLISHINEIKKDVKRKDVLEVSYFVLSQYLEIDELPPREDVQEMLGKIIINGITILDEQEDIATGLYVGPSIFNHSCQPNVTVIFDGPRLFVRSIVDLSNLDISKIFINYIDLLETTEVRQQKLQEQYYFLCECPVCLDISRNDLMHTMKCGNPHCCHPVILDKESKCNGCSRFVNAERVQHAKAIMKSLEHLTEKLTCQPNDTTNREKFNVVLENAKEILHPYNIFLIKGLDEAFEYSIEMKDYEKALKNGLDKLPGYRKFSSEAQIEFGLLLAKIGKIQLLLNHLEDAKKTLLEANDYIRFRYGNKHPVYERFKKTLMELEISLSIRATQRC